MTEGSDMDTPLSDVFNSAEPAPEVPEVPEVAEPVIEEALTGDTPEPAEIIPDETPEATPPVAETPQDDPVSGQIKAFQAKALDETRKRQALEEQLKQYQNPVEVPDAFAEPDKAIQHATKELEQKFENRFLNMSEVNARARHEDFDAIKDVFFNEMLSENPALQQQALSNADPYGFIYKSAKNYVDLKDIGDIDSWKSQKEAEIRAQVESEYAGKVKAAAEKVITGAIPATLSNATAAGGNVNQGYTGPVPLDKVFGKR